MLSCTLSFAVFLLRLFLDQIKVQHSEWPNCNRYTEALVEKHSEDLSK